MKAGFLVALLLLGGVVSGSPPAAAPDPVAPAFDAGSALAASQAAIGRELGDHALTAADGRRVAISEFRGRPLVISPVYTSCYHVCPTTTAYLARIAAMASEVLGEGAFAVLTVGFDTAHDTPGRMQAYARARGIDSPQWVFASADAETLARLVDDIGFRFAPAAGGFDHMVQATIVGPDGRVYRQVYGQEFEPPLLVDGLKRLVLGQRAAESSLPALVETARLICTVFDPKTGRYRFDYSIVLAMLIGAACLGGIAAFIWRSWRELPPDRPA